jgi:anti-anti-sigma factor
MATWLVLQQRVVRAWRAGRSARMTDDAATDLIVDLTEEGDLTILTVRGELDAYSAPTLDAAFDRAVSEGARQFVLDLSDVGFIDSSGLRSMIRVRKQVGDGPEALRIRNPQPATVRLLDITGLTDHFPLA